MVGQDKISLESQKTELTSSAISRPNSAKNFIGSYENYCSKNNSHPLKDVKIASSSVKGTLDLIVDKIKLNDWIPLLKAVAGDRSLHSISFKSRINQGNVFEDVVTETQVRELKKGPVLFAVHMMQKFLEACMNCLEHSKTIRIFHLEKIPLTGDLMQIHSQGLAKTCCLQKLILIGCQLGDDGCAMISEAVKKLPSIRTLDLTANDITSKGAKNLASLIKFQDISRYNECWKHSLRCREVNTDVIPGLRRLTINENQEIRDKGLKYIIDALYDDNWIKAIDMQNCGITDWGCSAVHKLLESNKEIVVFDLRKNDIIDMTAMASMISILGSHMSGDDMTEFGWMDIESPVCLGSSEDSSSGGVSSQKSNYSLVRSNKKVAKYIESNCRRHVPLRPVQSAATFFPGKSQSSLQQFKLIQPVTKSRSMQGSLELSRNFSKSSLLGMDRLPRPAADAKMMARRAAARSVLQTHNQQTGLNRQLSQLNVPRHSLQKQLRCTQSEQCLPNQNRPISSRTFTCENRPKRIVKTGGDTSKGSSGKLNENEKILSLLQQSNKKLEPVSDQWKKSPKVVGRVSPDEKNSIPRSTEKIEEVWHNLFRSLGGGSSAAKKESESKLPNKEFRSSSIENLSLNSSISRRSYTKGDDVKHQRCTYFNRLDVDCDE